MKIGTKVVVANPKQVNYLLEGVITDEDPCANKELSMSKVKFEQNDTECWYTDKDLLKTP